MITPEQTMELKETIGTNYAGKVLEKLKARGITTRNGSEYTQSTISKVFTGKRSNPEIEAAILDIHDEKVKEWAERNSRLGIVTE